MLKKKICFPFIGDSVGGSHKSALILIKNLNKKLFDPVVVLHKKGHLVGFLKKNNISYKLLNLQYFIGEKKGVLFLLFSIFKSSFLLSYFLFKNKIDIVHTNDTGMHLTWSIPCFFTRKKLIWHIRNLYPRWPLFFFFSIFPKNFLCISKFVKDSIPRIYKKKSKLVYNPIELKKIKKTNFKERLGLKKNNFVIGFVSNLWKRKNPLKFIELAQFITDKGYKNIFFLIAGSDRDLTKKDLEREIKKRNLSKRIKLLNFVSSVDPLLASLDLVFAPADNEPFGRVLIESMIAKTPVIANKSGGHLEIIKDKYNGWLCDIKDIKSVSKLILDIYKKKNKKMKEITQNAYFFVKKEFNSQNHIKTVINFYN